MASRTFSPHSERLPSLLDFSFESSYLPGVFNISPNPSLPSRTLQPIFFFCSDSLGLLSPRISSRGHEWLEKSHRPIRLDSLPHSPPTSLKPHWLQMPMVVVPMRLMRKSSFRICSISVQQGRRYSSAEGRSFHSQWTCTLPIYFDLLRIDGKLTTHEPISSVLRHSHLFPLKWQVIFDSNSKF